MKIGIIGFGEAGHMFGKHLAKHADVHAFDLIQDDAMRAKAASANVTFHTRLVTAIGGADYILSLVTAEQAPVAAKQAAPFLKDTQYFLEMNSVAPGTKQKNTQH